ncbi:MAG: hypothetical protein EXR58_07550 [Chloroflexi bacterium]|nr:hypothetical protein [Chloroflexota bacterium]
MGLDRRAEASWEGDLLTGKGLVTAATTQLFKDLPVSWASRTDAPSGRTSPEELLAASHASCYSMALSHGLAQGQHDGDGKNHARPTLAERHGPDPQNPQLGSARARSLPPRHLVGRGWDRGSW